MNSDLAEALRLIFPLTARGATVDFFGTDALDFFTEDFEDEAFVELLFGFLTETFACVRHTDRLQDEQCQSTRTGCRLPVLCRYDIGVRHSERGKSFAFSS